MEESECVDLESLIELIDDNESPIGISESEQSNSGIAHESNECGLDSLNKDDSTITCRNEKQKKIIKLNDFMFSDATVEKSDAPGTPQNDESSLVHMGDTSSDEEEKEHLTEMGQQIKEKIKLRSYYGDRKKRESNVWKSEAISRNQSCSKEEPQSLDRLTGIRIINPLVAFDVMEKRLKGRKLVKMSFIKNFASKGSDIENDWVTIGVLVRKVPPKTSKTGKLFSIWKLTDLHNTDKIVSLFLFGNVHTEHWKMAVGTVIGLLNPTIMDSNDKDDYMTVKVDHPGKVMAIGTSKDLGHCKSKRKDGTQCTSVVNMSQCQFCTYHVKNEYKKLGSQRTYIHSSGSGSVRDKVLKGQNFFYGGQSFVPLGKPQKKTTNSLTPKDKLMLSNLTLKRKVSTVLNEEKSKSAEKVTEMYGEAVSKTAEKNSEFINNRLLIPSPGSRNLLQHMIKNKTPGEKTISTMHPRELLKQQALLMKSQLNKKDDSTLLKNLQPVLAKGLNPGQTLTFDVQSSPRGQFAKMRAIQKIREHGPIKRKNPNAVKSNPEPKKIKAALDTSMEVDQVNEKEAMLRSRLGCIDLNSEKIQKYLNRNSSHAYEIEMAEMEREAAYFERLEKREMMEEKMTATKEIVCDVVSCKQCRYTAHQAADRCKNENHPLKCHKAIKRFYACKDCKHRTDCFSRFPFRSCSMCGSSRYERTGMMKVRSGPKLDSEILNIRSDDAYFLNSL